MAKSKNIGVKIFLHAVQIFVIVVSVFPILWVIVSSFKTNGQILSSPFSLPTSISFEPYIYLFEKYNFLRYTFNSLLVAASSTLVSLFFFAMGGYALGKYRFPGRNLIFALFTITMLVPTQAKAQPIFSLIMKLNLYDNIWGLALVYLSSGMAMSIFVLRSTFMSIPKSLDEAAMLDGVGFFRIFWSINLPLAKNGLATAGVLMFLHNWNEYFYASLITSSDRTRTLPIALQLFNESLSYDYTKLFAALVVCVLPGIIIYALAQEQVQSGLASGGVKG